MPPRKEPKEAIIYPASKRKAPAFKPQRPSKFPRADSAESSTSAARQPSRSVSAPLARKPSAITQISDDEPEDQTTTQNKKKDSAQVSDVEDTEDSEEELAADPRASFKQPTKKPAPTRLAPKKKAPRSAARITVSSSPEPEPEPERAASIHSLSSPEPTTQHTSHQTALPPSSDLPLPSQPLLLRLLHESFADKNTKVDKHAIQVLQKYVEVFVREAIARTAKLKEEKADRGEAIYDDRAWLEVEDLEGVVAGLLLDF